MAKQRCTIQLPRLFLALSPVILWCAFCLLYYGFILPNTKYAKLNTGLGSITHLKQGLHYAISSFSYDLVGFAAITAALFLGIRERRANPLIPLAAAGIANYLAYIIYVGGDYMIGRFFVAPLYLSFFIIFHAYHDIRLRLAPYLFLLGVISAASLLITRPLMGDLTDASRNYGIVDERQIYSAKLGLFTPSLRLRQNPQTDGWIWGRQENGMAELDKRHGITHVVSRDTIGIQGYYAGRDTIMIDILGLGDALLARLPAVANIWRIGHFMRSVPAGYMETRRTGDSSQMQPDLRQYYEKLRLLTSAPLFDPQRLRAIAGFQLGRYDALLDNYLESLKKN